MNHSINRSEVFQYLCHYISIYYEYSAYQLPYHEGTNHYYLFPVSIFADFREEFRSVPKSQNTIAGDRLILNCTPPRGFPEPKIAWKKDGQFLYPATDTRINIMPGGDLKIENVQTNDQGRYNCIAENIVGLRESPPATVKVLGNYFPANSNNSLDDDFGEAKLSMSFGRKFLLVRSSA